MRDEVEVQLVPRSETRLARASASSRGIPGGAAACIDMAKSRNAMNFIYTESFDFR